MLSLPLPASLSPPVSLTHSISLSFPLSLSLFSCLSFSLFLSLSFPVSLTFFSCLSLFLSLSFFLSLSLPLIICHFLSYLSVSKLASFSLSVSCFHLPSPFICLSVSLSVFFHCVPVCLSLSSLYLVVSPLSLSVVYTLNKAYQLTPTLQKNLEHSTANSRNRYCHLPKSDLFYI